MMALVFVWLDFDGVDDSNGNVAVKSISVY